MKDNQGHNKKSNQLINESSPYLLQHAYNPVEWYPWGEAALSKAKEEDKLLIISIGYAACHWCHVMEHESFEDSLVASVMNENFVSIKVDREERPDIDDIYMTAAQMINGRGGWPLNAIALPDGKPLFAGTYYPKEDWIRILNQIIKIKNENPQRLQESANQITEGIQNTTLVEVNTSDFTFSKSDLNDFVSNTLGTFDTKYGGRLGAPKFPMPNTYEFLMKYHWLTGNEEALKTTLTGIDNMAKGGIYDQLGGGFARYSVDEYWLVPHFEKMLYDNGQLISIYAQAYQLTKDPFYKKTIEQTLEYIEREMTSKENGFFSSLDADSEGEEGKFYIWTEEEIDRVLGDNDNCKIFKSYYDVSKLGNWEHKNILNIKGDKEQLSKKYETSIAEIETILDDGIAKLMVERDKRVRPGLDDKVLTSWNALMISGYVDAYNALGTEDYLDKALANAQFLSTKQMKSSGQLYRNYKDGKSAINAFLDDYALLIHAFCKLYQSTFDKQWIDKAQLLADYTIEHFYNDTTKMFDYTSKIDPALIAKKAEYADNVIPASNSSMARSLLTLGTLLYNKDYLDKADQMLNNMLPQIEASAYLSFYSNWLQLLLDKVYPPYEIAIIGDDAQSKRKKIQSHYLGHSIILGSEKDENLELLKEKLQEGQTTIYVCQNKACKLPVTDVDQALGLLKE